MLQCKQQHDHMTSGYQSNASTSNCEFLDTKNLSKNSFEMQKIAKIPDNLCSSQNESSKLLEKSPNFSFKRGRNSVNSGTSSKGQKMTLKRTLTLPGINNHV